VGRAEGWPARPRRFDRIIVVPFPPESASSGVGAEEFHPVVWYHRRFRHRCPPGRRLLLHFGAVDYRAAVWVNGQLVAEHEGGHTPFYADVTEALRSGGEQDLVVRAEDQPADLEQTACSRPASPRAGPVVPATLKR
jgi:beta-galactosidase/beta-glucuronidase